MPYVRLVGPPTYTFRGVLVKRGEVIEVSNKDRNHLILTTKTNRGDSWVDHDPCKPVEPDVFPEEDEEVFDEEGGDIVTKPKKLSFGRGAAEAVAPSERTGTPRSHGAGSAIKNAGAAVKV